MSSEELYRVSSEELYRVSSEELHRVNSEELYWSARLQSELLTTMKPL